MDSSGSDMKKKRLKKEIIGTSTLVSAGTKGNKEVFGEK